MANSIQLNCLDPKALTPHGANSAELEGFLSQVAHRKSGRGGEQRGRKYAGGYGYS